MRSFGALFRNLSCLSFTGLSWCWRLIVASSLMLGFISAAHAAAVSGWGTWETTLQARYFDNDATVDGYYDTALNITWLANANAGAGSAYDNLANPTDGHMTWANANAWAASLNFNGITGWRLPTTVDVGNNGCSTPYSVQGLDCGYNISAHSEMSHMFYVTLGNKAYYSTSGTAAQPGWGLINTANFTNLLASYYWSATQNVNPFYAWQFNFYSGEQDARDGYIVANGSFAWAVHSGDVGAAVVPIPAAVWLFGSGLLALMSVARCRRA